MMKPRKTVAVAEIKKSINVQLARIDNTPEERLALAMFLESVLFDARCYAGFGYVAWRREGGWDRWVAAGEPRDERGNIPREYIGDETRRIYY